MRIVKAFGGNERNFLLCSMVLLVIISSVIISNKAYANKSFFRYFIEKNQKNSYWLGKGSILLKGGETEALKCRATYFLADNSELKQNLRCASASYNIVAKSRYQSNKNVITGQWAEETFNIRGNVSGRLKGNRLNLEVKGRHINADMSIVVKKCSKVIKIVPKESVVTLISMKFGRC